MWDGYEVGTVAAALASDDSDYDEDDNDESTADTSSSSGGEPARVLAAPVRPPPTVPKPFAFARQPVGKTATPGALAYAAERAAREAAEAAECARQFRARPAPRAW